MLERSGLPKRDPLFNQQRGWPAVRAFLFARLAPPVPPKSPWVDWLRSSLLPLAIFAIGAFVTYNHDQASIADRLAQMSKSLDGVSQRLDRDERDTADRVRDLVPVIRASDIFQKESELIDRQQSEHIKAMAQSVIRLRQTVETLSKAVSKTHEDLMIDRARRSEKEGRLIPAGRETTSRSVKV